MSDELEALVRERSVTVKIKNKSQIPYAALIMIITAIIAVSLWRTNHKYVIYWIAGIAIGFVLRYSRFCFAGAFRDPFLLKNTKLMRAMLISLMISTAGFAFIQYGYLKNNPIDYYQISDSINFVGLHTVIGAFIFGIGMIIAGGCASGVLMRIGEGHILPLVTLLGFFIGTTLGAKDYSFWYDKIINKTKVVYFPEYINIGAVVIGQMIVLIGLYRLAAWYERKISKK